MLKYHLFFIFFFSTLVAFAQSENENLPLADTLIDADKIGINDTIEKGTVKMNGDIRISGLIERYKKHNEGKLMDGYRIQLYSGSRNGALEAKKNFLAKMPQIEATVVYESPDFKMQVGNYRDKLEAEKAMQTIWPAFKSAFIVKTKIGLPKLDQPKMVQEEK